MRNEQIQLFKPKIKNYGFVFNLDFDPVLFIVNSKNKISEGIPIVEDTAVMTEEELDYYLDNDMYMLLDPCETIMVSVDVCDILLNEINVDDITDENFNNYTYSLTPLKMQTLPNEVFTCRSDNPFKKELINIMRNYKKVFKKSKF